MAYLLDFRIYLAMNHSPTSIPSFLRVSSTINRAFISLANKLAVVLLCNTFHAAMLQRSLCKKTTANSFARDNSKVIGMPYWVGATVGSVTTLSPVEKDDSQMLEHHVPTLDPQKQHLTRHIIPHYGYGTDPLGRKYRQNALGTGSFYNMHSAF